ncbi:MAG: hypothetical protein HQK58_09125 [Deltaproteobacteria bacterium]|nr:hypothetical protein [Deltaproteobacteria bacterium]
MAAIPNSGRLHLYGSLLLQHLVDHPGVYNTRPNPSYDDFACCRNPKFNCSLLLIHLHQETVSIAGGLSRGHCVDETKDYRNMSPF